MRETAVEKIQDFLKKHPGANLTLPAPFETKSGYLGVISYPHDLNARIILRKSLPTFLSDSGMTFTEAQDPDWQPYASSVFQRKNV